MTISFKEAGATTEELQVGEGDGSSGAPWLPMHLGGSANALTVRANYTTAQTNTALITAAAGEIITVTRFSFMVDNACSVDVGYTAGFHASATPSGANVLSSHPGVAAGSGVVEGNGGGMLGKSQLAGDDLLIDCEVPTDGSVTVVVTYILE